MKRWAFLGLLSALGLAAGSANAQFGMFGQYDYYDGYDVGYDDNVGDDWFFDYYDYNEVGFEDDDDFGYADYDMNDDEFGWEEQGLF